MLATKAMVLLNISLPSPHIPSQPCYKNIVEHNKIPQFSLRWEEKVAPTKTRPNTRHNIFEQLYKNWHGPPGKRSKADLRPRAFRGSGQLSLLAAPSGLCCRNRTGPGGCWGAGKDPSSHSKVQVTDWSVIGWGRCRRLLPERGTQGDSRGPNSCPSPTPCPRWES